MSGTTRFRKGKRAYLYARNEAANNGSMRCCYCGCPLVAGWTLNTSPRQRAWLERTGAGIATLDHVVPVAMGGSNDPENVVVVCHACNLRKGASELWEVFEAADEVAAVIEMELRAEPGEAALVRMRARLRCAPRAGWGPGRSPGGPSPTARTYGSRLTGDRDRMRRDRQHTVKARISDNVHHT